MKTVFEREKSGRSERKTAMSWFPQHRVFISNDPKLGIKNWRVEFK